MSDFPGEVVRQLKLCAQNSIKGNGVERSPVLRKKNRVAVSTLLYQHFLRKEEKRFSIRKDGWMHVTDIWDNCMRQVYLANSLSVTVTQVVHPSSWVKFRIGEALESVLKKEMYALGIIVEDDHVRDENLKIIGHHDVRFKNGMVGEIKCMDPVLFRLAKKYPLRHHQFQVETYLCLDRQFSEAPLVSFSYGSDEMPFREQTIAYNVKTKEDIKRAVAPLREAEAGGPLPNRCCTSMSDKRAVVCPVARQCFQMENKGDRVLTIKELREAQ